MVEKMEKHSIKYYVRIARPDHWFKNVFLAPGVVFAFYDSHHLISFNVLLPLALAIISTCLVASSNYTINEILDAPKDAFHPLKKHRPIPSGKVNIRIAYIQWLILGILGLSLAWILGKAFFFTLVKI